MSSVEFERLLKTKYPNYVRKLNKFLASHRCMKAYWANFQSVGCSNWDSYSSFSTSGDYINIIDIWERISELWEDKNIRIQREDIEILYNKE